MQLSPDLTQWLLGLQNLLEALITHIALKVLAIFFGAPRLLDQIDCIAKVHFHAFVGPVKTPLTQNFGFLSSDLKT